MDTHEKQADEKIKEILARPKNLNPYLRILIGVLAGLSAAGFMSYMPMAGALFMPLIVFPVLLALTVYGAADLLGYAVFALVYEAGQFRTAGVMLSMVGMLAVIIPTAVMIALELNGKMRFYDRMFLSLGIELIGLVSALALIRYINGEEIAEQAGSLMSKSFSLLNESSRERMAVYYADLFKTIGIEIDMQDTAHMLEDVVRLFTEIMKISLPAVLVVTAAANVFPGCLLCSYIRTKRNVAGAAYEPVRAWRMPPRYIGGLALLTAAGAISSAVSSSGAVVLTTVLTACTLAFFIQYLASITDRLGRSELSKGMKVFLFIADTLLLFQLLPVYGLLSMLFGSKGVISGYIRKRRSERKEN